MEYLADSARKPTDVIEIKVTSIGVSSMISHTISVAVAVAVPLSMPEE